MNLDELRAAMSRVRRVNAGENHVDVYGEESNGFEKLVDQEYIFRALTDPTPIDKEFILRCRGDECTHFPGDFTICTGDDDDRVEIRLYADTDLTPDVWLNGRPIGREFKTRGQLLLLLAALGAGEKGDTDND